MLDHIWWYLARATGIFTLALSGGAVLWGLLLSTRIIRRRSLPKWLLDLHRFLGALTVAFLALHVGTLMLDSYVSFAVKDAFVPMASKWKAGAVAWGIVAMYLLLVVEATSLVKNHLPQRLWHITHLLSFVAFGLSITHAATAGTDSANRVYLVVAIAMTTAVVFLTMFRIVIGRRSRKTPPATERVARRAEESVPA